MARIDAYVRCIGTGSCHDPVLEAMRSLWYRVVARIGAYAPVPKALSRTSAVAAGTDVRRISTGCNSS
jgi:hypothetical protein